MMHDENLDDERQQPSTQLAAGRSSTQVATALRAAIYARSIVAPETGGQVRQLRRLVQERGWSVQGVYSDSGKPSERRPDLDRLVEAVTAGAVDVLVVTGLDRLAKSARHLVLLLQGLVARGVEIIAFEDGIDTTTGVGVDRLDGLLLAARIEHELARERGRDSIASARRRGIKVGRPRAVIDIEKARSMRADGASLREVAQSMNVGVATIHEALQGAL
jgi:DNA invertase Pin-like site-specific DNA recombinase